MLCGHEHKYNYITPNAQVAFPILINDNETYLDVNVDNKSMNILVKDRSGGELHKFKIDK